MQQMKHADRTCPKQPYVRNPGKDFHSYLYLLLLHNSVKRSGLQIRPRARQMSFVQRGAAATKTTILTPARTCAAEDSGLSTVPSKMLSPKSHHVFSRRIAFPRIRYQHKVIRDQRLQFSPLKHLYALNSLRKKLHHRSPASL